MHELRFQKRQKIRKKTGKHKKLKGPKDSPVSKYRGQGKNN